MNPEDDEELKVVNFMDTFDHNEKLYQKQQELGYFPMDMQSACGFDT